MKNPLELANGALAMAKAQSSKASKVIEAIERFADQNKTDKDLNIAEAFLELRKELIDTKAGNLELQAELMEIKETLMDQTTQQDILDQYELHSTSEGEFAYSLKKEFHSDMPPHFACVKCYESGNRMILQGSEYYKTCPDCGKGVNFGTMPDEESRLEAGW